MQCNGTVAILTRHRAISRSDAILFMQRKCGIHRGTDLALIEENVECVRNSKRDEKYVVRLTETEGETERELGST